MTNARTPLLALAALAAMSLGGCVPTPTATPTVGPTTPASPSPSATPTPTFSAAQRPAADLVIRYYEVVNQVGADVNVPLDEFHRVAVGELVDHRLQVYSQYRRQGILQVGDIKVNVKSVAGDEAPYLVDACVDVSESDLRDQAGHSVVSPATPALVLHRFTIERFGDQLRAVSDEPVETPC